MFARRLFFLTTQTAKRSLSIAHYAKPLASKCVPLVKIPMRKMSDSTDTASLAEVLSNELQEEIQNDEINQEFLDIKNQIAKSFNINEKDGSGIVTLTSTTTKEIIEVVFDVQDEANEEEFEGDFEDQEDDEEDDEEEGGGIGIKFHVSVKKPSSEDKVVFYCVAGQQISVVNAQYLPIGKGVEDTDIYHGPFFDKLSDDLKESMLSYLADRGIDEDMAFFIMAYSENKEQREYMNWLKKLMVFVEAKMVSLISTSDRRCRTALASCTLPEFTEVQRYVNELQLVQKALQNLDCDCDIIPWDQVGVSWEDYDAVIISQTWDYTADFPKFTSWLKDVSVKSKLINDFPILKWSSDKIYLKELADAGVPVVPTVWVDAADKSSVDVNISKLKTDNGWGPDRGIIIKPAVACGSEGILYLQGGGGIDTDVKEGERAAVHILSLLAEGQRYLLIQPFLDAVKTFGEMSVVYIDGSFSHALLKTPSADDFRVQAEFGGSTRVVTANEGMLQVCRKVMCVLTDVCKSLGTEPPLYARIDLIPTHTDMALADYFVCEVELLEPELFFQDTMDHQCVCDPTLTLDDSYEWSHVRFAKGILKRLT